MDVHGIATRASTRLRTGTYGALPCGLSGGTRNLRVLIRRSVAALQDGRARNALPVLAA